jgi:5-methylcytosine-specific restriction endonuclease McrBC GTP-binding regulatory subunit McrB
MNLDELIGNAINSDFIQMLKKENGYYFQKLLEVRDKYIAHPLSKDILEEILSSYEDFNDGTFEDFVNSYEGIEGEFLDILGELISYLDVKASGKAKWNKYSPNRSIAQAGVRQNDWVRHLLSYKIDSNHILSASIHNALNYAIDPENNFTILSRKHREKLSQYLFNKEYESKRFNQQLKEFFAPYGIQVNNSLNYTYLISSIIYDGNILSLWNPKSEKKESLSIKKNDAKLENSISFLEQFGNWLGNNINQDEPFLNLLTQVRYLTLDLVKRGVINKAHLDELDNDTLILVQKAEHSKIITDKDSSYFFQFLKEIIMEQTTPLNQIFFGPPGTGKTYNTINEAIKIVDAEFYNAHTNDRDKLTQRYRELLITDWKDSKGQIAFCTFHQSFSYEDFVEGIKPQTNEEKNVFYDVLPGVFKRICELADSSQSSKKIKEEGKVSLSEEQFQKSFFYKLSLGEANNPDDRKIYDDCIKNNRIAIGFGQDTDYTGMTETEIKEDCKNNNRSTTAGSQLSTFIHGLSNNDYVVVSNGNNFVRALGRVKSDYYFIDNPPIRYTHFRDVEWIFVNENIPIEDLYSTTLTQRSIYKLDHDKLKKEFFVPNAAVYNKFKEEKIKPYVLIIDEINRGNVSSIFGELITLIEQDKRAGADEELEVMLPYSKDKFKVPNNVYIIGTMNTADRSVEALDSALRRRFSFREMPPKSRLILEKGRAKDGMVDGINLATLLDTINLRIEKLIDKDHRIGHSYFLNVKDMPSLKACFNNEVIPLLEEYFFGDYGKIGLVLGDSFVEKQINKRGVFSKFEGYETDIIADLEERAVYKIKPSSNWDFKAI